MMIADFVVAVVQQLNIGVAIVAIVELWEVEYLQRTGGCSRRVSGQSWAAQWLLPLGSKALGLVEF